MVRFTELSAARRGARRKLAAANQGATRTSILATVVDIDPEDTSRLLVSVDPADPDLSVLAGPTKVVPGALVHVEVDSAGRPIRVLGPASTRPDGLDEGVPAPAPIVPMEGLAPRELSEAEAQAIRETADGLAQAQQDLADAAGLLAAIGASDGPEGVAEALTDYLAIPLDQITVVDNRGADEQVIAHLYDSIIVEGLLTASEIITGGMLADGAVTARTLNVVPEEGTGGMELQPPGFRIIPSDAEAGTAVSMRTDEESWIAFAQGGEQTFSVTPDGHLTAQQVSANAELLYRGEEFSDILESFPRGVVAGTELAVTATVSTSTARLMTVSFTSPPTRRAYRVRARVAVAVAARTRLYYTVKWATGATVAANNTDRGNSYRIHDGFSAREEILEFVIPDSVFAWGGNNQITLGLFLRTLVDPGPVTVQSAAYGTSMTIEDIGPAYTVESSTPYVPSTGGGGSTGSDTAPTKSKQTRTFSPTWSQSYTGSGNQYNVGGSGRLYHGQYLPANGVLRSMVGFDRAAIMSFCSGAEMVSARIYIRNVHSWSNSGVRGRFGYRNNASKPATWGTGDMTLIGEADFTKGQGRWIGLNASGVLAALKSGGFGAFALNPATTAADRYGYWTSSGVKLEITVRK